MIIAVVSFTQTKAEYYLLIKRWITAMTTLFWIFGAIFLLGSLISEKIAIKTSFQAKLIIFFLGIITTLHFAIFYSYITRVSDFLRLFNDVPILTARMKGMNKFLKRFVLPMPTS